MKKLLLLLCLTLSLSACGTPNGPETSRDLRDRRNIQLTVFADASLSDAFETVAARYRNDNPGIRLLTYFGPSDALASEIRDGAACDVFVSASPEAMYALENAGMLPVDSHAAFLENRLVLAVPVGNPRGVRNFAHMASLIRQDAALFAAVNPGDALGAYTRTLFGSYFLSESALSKSVTYAPDARETVARIRADMVDGGVVYRSDAGALEIVDTADAPGIVYSAGVLSGSERPLAAAALLEYLTGPDAAEVFTRAGFVTLTQADAPYWETFTPEDFQADPDAEDGF